MSKFNIERLKWEIATKQTILPHLNDLIEIIRSANNEGECIKRICSQFNVSSEQAEFLIGLPIEEITTFYPEYLQKQYNEIVKLERNI